MTNATTPLGPRPSPEKISFAPECFERGPDRTEFVIVFAAPKYPERFSNEADAAARSRRVGRSYHREVVPTERRIRWF